MKREKDIPKKKKEAVKEITDLIKKKKTFLVVSIKNLPAAQYQEIIKKIRDKAIVKVPRKNLLMRAIKDSGEKTLLEIGDDLDNSFAILFSDLDGFELSSDLIDSKTPARAKAGQEATEDIEVHAGPTDLMPGPAITELGALGIQIQIEKGKINIKESKVVVKAGEKVSADAANVLGKLDIKPFMVGFTPLTVFDSNSKKLYKGIKIDKKATIEMFKQAYGKALPFAVEIGYTNDETIKHLLAKGHRHASGLHSLTNTPTKSEENTQL